MICAFEYRNQMKPKDINTETVENFAKNEKVYKS